MRMAGFNEWCTALVYDIVVFYQMGSRRYVAAGEHLPKRG